MLALVRPNAGLPRLAKELGCASMKCGWLYGDRPASQKDSSFSKSQASKPNPPVSLAVCAAPTPVTPRTPENLNLLQMRTRATPTPPLSLPVSAATNPLSPCPPLLYAGSEALSL